MMLMQTLYRLKAKDRFTDCLVRVWTWSHTLHNLTNPTPQPSFPALSSHPFYLEPALAPSDGHYGADAEHRTER